MPKNGNNLRYAGLKGCTDYRKAAQIIKDGGYATSRDYVEKLCSIIERWNLTRFDADVSETSDNPEAPEKFPYFVRISISDLNIREKPAADSNSRGYTGKGVYTIVDEQDGWGLLKSYAEKRNGWIKLSYTEKV